MFAFTVVNSPTTRGQTLDIAVNGDFLYVLQAGAGNVAVYQISPDDGSLVLLDEERGIQPGINNENGKIRLRRALRCTI